LGALHLRAQPSAPRNGRPTPFVSKKNPRYGTAGPAGKPPEKINKKAAAWCWWDGRTGSLCCVVLCCAYGTCSSLPSLTGTAALSIPSAHPSGAWDLNLGLLPSLAPRPPPSTGLFSIFCIRKATVEI
jgi:hypothetical protein